MSYRALNLPQEKHVFLDRNGGVSQGKYASLNVRFKSDDKKENVYENLRRCALSLGEPLDHLVVLNQVSGTDVVLVTKGSLGEIVADGVVTTTEHLVLAIGTADCLPLLLADYQHGVIGAAHAGWRGAVRGVIENTLELMLEQGAKKENIVAATGPCLQQASFEVGADLYDECCRQNDAFKSFFALGKDDKHWQFDLEGLVCSRLKQWGISHISASGIDTYLNHDYFSYRRDKKQGNVLNNCDFGGHISLIKL